jgi:phospholipid/cholesterol/gamma-HCH transport system substrate-binding protein
MSNLGEQTKNLLIGIFVIGACALVVSFIMFLKPSVGNGEKTYYIRFANINKINVGTRVTFAGKPVGEVTAIREIFHAREQPTDSVGRLYFFELVLKVDSSVDIYDTDEISLQTSGLLGEKSVAIIPKPAPKGVIPKLVTNQPIYAESVDPIENAFNELSSLAKKMESTFADVNEWFDQNSGDLTKAVKSFGGAMEQVESAVKTINTENIVQDVKVAVNNISTFADKMNQTITQMEQNEVFSNVAAVMDNMKTATRSIDVITADIANGTGTIGRLVKSDDLYLRFSAVMSKVDTLMNDVNHYGLLFHLNKGWQRTRTKQMNALNALDSPSEFKQYFQTEVDQINTSMSRISILIDKAQEAPEKAKILESDPFKRDFAELMRLTNELADNLKLYNEQLHDDKGCE